TALAVQPDGAVLLGGSAGVTPTDSQWAFARLTSSGAPDPTFGTSGQTTLSWDDVATSPRNQLTALAVQPDGAILAVGTADSRYFAIARLKPDGTRDSTFGGDGRMTIGFGSPAEAFVGASDVGLQ